MARRASARRPGIGGTTRVGIRGTPQRGGPVAPPQWIPLNLTNLRGWYRADQQITLVGSDVDIWNDLSGFNNHISAASAGARPLFVASSAVFGNQPCVEFDGVAEWLRRAVFDCGGVFGPLTVACVMQSVTFSVSEQFLNYGTGNRPMLRQGGTNTFQFISQGAVTVNGAASALVPGGAARLIGGWWDLANHASFVAAVESAPAASAAAAHADDQIFAVGASVTGTVPANVRIAEIIVMNARITAGELTQLQGYVNTRYGLT